MADAKAIVTQAARRHGIDPKILWGVYGTETSFGKNVSTSSAGAVGPFQFEPSTAKSLGVNPYDFKSAADGAARYLAQYKSRGTAGMLSAYNAGPAGALQPSYVASVLKNGGVSGSFPVPSSSAPGSVARTTTRPSMPQGPTRHERGLAQLASLIRSEDRSSPLPGLLESKLSTGSELGSKDVGSPLVSLPKLVSPSRSEAPQGTSASVGGPAAPNLHKVAPPVNVKLPGYITGKGFPAVEKGKAALERAEGHPVSVHELERAVTKSEHTGEVVATTKAGHPIVKTGGHTVYIPHPTRSKKGDQYHGG